MHHLQKIIINSSSFPVSNVYPFNLGFLQADQTIEIQTPVTFFIGDNGCGKSTLLRAICHACNIHIWKDEGRTKLNHNKFENTLSEHLNIQWAGQKVAGDFFSPSYFQFFREVLDEWASTDPGIVNYFGGSSLMECSHGQSILQDFRNRYKLKGLYILDEPETALSAGSQIELLELLQNYSEKNNAQFIIASHSPILLSLPTSTIYQIDAKINNVNYFNTQYYKIYAEFFEKQKKVLSTGIFKE